MHVTQYCRSPQDAACLHKHGILPRCSGIRYNASWQCGGLTRLQPSTARCLEQLQAQSPLRVARLAPTAFPSLIAKTRDAPHSQRRYSGYSGQAFLKMSNERSDPNKEPLMPAARPLSLGDAGFSTRPLSAGQEVMIMSMSAGQARQVQGTVQH